eukprot:1048477_1
MASVVWFYSRSDLMILLSTICAAVYGILIQSWRSLGNTCLQCDAIQCFKRNVAISNPQISNTMAGYKHRQYQVIAPRASHTQSFGYYAIRWLWMGIIATKQDTPSITRTRQIAWN